MTCPFEGVTVKSLVRVTDPRGWLMELFRQDELTVELHPAMCYLSVSKPGVTRGPHEHRKQTDLFVFAGPGQFRVYLWDNRTASATFAQRWQMDCGETSPTQIAIPPGVVHAYRNIGAGDGVVYNAPNRLYRGVRKQDGPDEIRHEDDPTTRFRIDD